jgi:pyridoxamine 5'-phosphate oxidase
MSDASDHAPTNRAAPDAAWGLEAPPDDPAELFDRWMRLATESGVLFPASMSLATASPAGRPSNRTVILKGWSPAGLVFETESYSRKGTELAQNPFVAVTLHWREVHRQICATGAVEVLPAEVSNEMWARRPRERQAASVVSHQGAVLDSEEELRRRALDVIATPGPIARPPTYQAHRLVPETLEFWEGHDDRLHRRVYYERGPVAAGGAWSWRRLQP